MLSFQIGNSYCLIKNLLKYHVSWLIMSRFGILTFQYVIQTPLNHSFLWMFNRMHGAPKSKIFASSFWFVFWMRLAAMFYYLKWQLNWSSKSKWRLNTKVNITYGKENMGQVYSSTENLWNENKTVSEIL